MTSILPVLGRYSITVDRGSIMLYGFLSLFTFSVGLGVGVASYVSWDMRQIIAQNTVNRIVLESMKTDTRDMERQLRITSEQVRSMEQRMLDGKL